MLEMKKNTCNCGVWFASRSLLAGVFAAAIVAGMSCSQAKEKPTVNVAQLLNSVTVPDGFRVELVYSVPLAEQGSWVALTPDEKGRLIASDQFGSLYRVKVGERLSETAVERLNLPIGHAQGLLYAYDSLYVTVNLYRTAKEKIAQGSGLYRLLDSDGDDQFDKVMLLKRLETAENENGHGEHGPHGLRLGPDGLIYLVAGNGTQVPQGLAPTSPYRRWADDLLIPSADVFVPGGWIARTNSTGTSWDLYCGGLRNPYDIAFDPDGELFAHDADSEADIGTPWYRPTRVNHLVSGGEYGWRYDSGPWLPYGKWPDYYPDSVGSVVDIGPGSPTGITSGTGASFPAKYQRALFSCDWAAGKIHAIHLQQHGASYRATSEPFLTASSLPLTDVVINRDGAMYFTVGGRQTQSGLFRIRYVGTEPTGPVKPMDSPLTSQARQLRRRLEQFHGRKDPRAVNEAWPHLASRDRAIRYAARIAIERQDSTDWQNRAFQENHTTASVQAMLGLARVGDSGLQGKVLERLNQLPLEKLAEELRLDALRAYGLAFLRMGGKRPEMRRLVVARLEPLFPSPSETTNRELCRLLVYLEAPGAIDRSLELLHASQTQRDPLFYFATLDQLRNSWTLIQRKAFFSSLNRAQEEYIKGTEAPTGTKVNNRFISWIQRFRQNAIEKLSNKERAALQHVMLGQQNDRVVDFQPSRRFLHRWQMSDLLPLLNQLESGRSYQSGKSAYEAAQCTKCHRFGDQGGTTGPDITTVGKRYSPQYLLEALLVPSKVIPDQFRNEIVKTKDGHILYGRLVYDDGKRFWIRTDEPPPHTLAEVSVNKVELRRTSEVSEMPEGLIDVLAQEEVLDLIAYLRAGGNPDDKPFKTPGTAAD